MGSKGRKEASVETEEKARENQVENEVKVISINSCPSYISLRDQPARDYIPH